MKKTCAFLMILFFVISFMPLINAEEQCEIGETYVQGLGCFIPNINAEYRVTEDTEGLSSSLEVIRINNPYAAAGQPVVVEFTLKNKGGVYPYSEIPLPPDSFILQLVIDKDLGVVFSDGSTFDVYSEMKWYEKVSFNFMLGGQQFYELAQKEIEGASCGYVRMNDFLPDRINKIIQARGKGKDVNVYIWHCLKIVDFPFFNNQIKSYCKEGIDESCISKINSEQGNRVSDTVTVLLTSEVNKGECVRPYDGMNIFGKIASFAGNQHNFVLCGIGKNGLQPGESATFRFVALVPADTPSLTIENFGELFDSGKIKRVEGSDPDSLYGYTQSASCLEFEADTAQSCHTIYGAVLPARNENVFNWFTGVIEQRISILGCTLAEVKQFQGIDSFKGCLSVGTGDVQGIGKPIWEGRGSFFVLAPNLSGSITMILWGFFALGAVTPASLARRLKR